MGSVENIPEHITSQQFHSIHTDDVRILKNQSKAWCYGQDGKQILYTSRPVRFNEYVCFDIKNIKSEEFIAFGFTSNEPVDQWRWLMEDLKGYNEVPKKEIVDGHVLLSFYLTPFGHIFCEVNQKQIALTSGQVDTTNPLWAVLLIIDPEKMCNSLKYQVKGIEFKQMDLKWMHGKGTYVCAKKKVRAGDHVVLKLLSRNHFPVTLGLTICDPSRNTLKFIDHNCTITSFDNILSSGDEISYTILPNGRVEYTLNGCNPTKGPFVDVKCDLWPFFRFYDADPEVKVFSGYFRKNLAQNTVKPVIVEILPGPSADNNNDCKLCCDSGVDVVLYPCGHMCMCYDCGMKQWKQNGDGNCPICRETIKDVVKVFR